MKIEVYSPTIRRKEMDAVLTAMVEDKIGPGEQGKFLIQIAREKIKFEYCIALRSPAIALYRALRSLNIEKGQGILVSALSPQYYALVIEELGLFPVFCDTQALNPCIDRDSVEKAIAEQKENLKIGAIILHHTLGYVSDSYAIAELGVPLIEDCSQSYGTYIEGEATANEGEAGGSTPPPPEEKARQQQVFFPHAGLCTILGLEEKDMLTSGGGALLFTASRREGTVLREMGELPPEYGLPDMNAAMAVVQFREASKNLMKRREIFKHYSHSALRTRHKRFVQGPISSPGETDLNLEYNNFAFPLVLETGMKDVKAYGRRKEIAVESAFDNTLVGSGLVNPEQCPHAYSLSLRTALFPMYPRLRMSDVEKVARLIQTLP